MHLALTVVESQILLYDIDNLFVVDNNIIAFVAVDDKFERVE